MSMARRVKCSKGGRKARALKRGGRLRSSAAPGAAAAARARASGENHKAQKKKRKRRRRKRSESRQSARAHDIRAAVRLKLVKRGIGRYGAVCRKQEESQVAKWRSIWRRCGARRAAAAAAFVLLARPRGVRICAKKGK